MSIRDDYYPDIARGIVCKWKDWLLENGHLYGDYGDLGQECQDMLVDLIAACLKIRDDNRKENNVTEKSVSEENRSEQVGD